jgi:tetratricopeptide (TPR) repeat protein
VLGLEPAEAELRMESLVDAAILDEPYPGRFRYHDLLHLFALGRATDPAEEGRALGRLLGLLLATARTAFALAVPGDPTGDVLGQDPPPEPGLPIADLRAARAWVADARGVIVTVCDKVVELGAAAPVRAAVDLLIALSPFADELRHGRLATVARDLAGAAARDAERSPDSPGHQRTAGRAEFLCSTVALRRGRPDEADTHARRAVHSASAGHDPVILRQALNDLGLVAQLRHDYTLAVTCFDRATALARDLGHRSGAVASGLNSAFARVRAGDPDRAVTDAEQALALAGELGDDAGGTFALYVLGLAHHARKDYDVAAERFIASARRSRAAGIRSREAQAQYRLADTLLALGRPGEALDQARTALRHCEDLGAERDQAQALMVLGRIFAETGRAAEAAGRFGRARALFAALGLPEEEEAARLAGG